MFADLHNHSLDDLLVEKQPSTRARGSFTLSRVYRPLDKLVDDLRQYQHIVCPSMDTIALARLAGCDAQYQNYPVTLHPVQVRAAAPWYFQHNYDPASPWTWDGSEFIVVNLADHSDRLVAIARHFEANPARTWQRFPAVKGADWIDMYQSNVEWDARVPFTGGRLGIYLSSLDIYAQLAQTRPHVQYYTILEDDVHFARNFVPNPAHIVGLAPRDWDIIFLGLNKKWCYRAPTDGPFIRLTPLCMPGAFAYIIRKRMARYFLKHAWPLTEPIDAVFQRLSNRFCFYGFMEDWAQADYTVVSSTSA